MATTAYRKFHRGGETIESTTYGSNNFQRFTGETKHVTLLHYRPWDYFPQGSSFRYAQVTDEMIVAQGRFLESCGIGVERNLWLSPASD
jgi:hypothetical protein